jgi:hypothetical protein
VHLEHGENCSPAQCDKYAVFESILALENFDAKVQIDNVSHNGTVVVFSIALARCYLACDSH